MIPTFWFEQTVELDERLAKEAKVKHVLTLELTDISHISMYIIIKLLTY